VAQTINWSGTTMTMTTSVPATRCLHVLRHWHQKISPSGVGEIDAALSWCFKFRSLSHKNRGKFGRQFLVSFSVNLKLTRLWVVQDREIEASHIIASYDCRPSLSANMFRDEIDCLHGLKSSATYLIPLKPTSKKNSGKRSLLGDCYRYLELQTEK
jgi:hypothetical protein